jgi:chromosome segregation ATPase
MAQEDLQELKYEVNLLKSKVDTSGREIDLLLQKLDTTADKLVDLTVTITRLCTLQEQQDKEDRVVREEIKTLHKRVSVEIEESETRVTEQIKQLREENTNQHHEFNQRLQLIENLRWLVMGGAIVLGVILSHLPKWMGWID